MLGRQVFAGTSRDSGTQRRLTHQALPGSFLSTTPSLYYTIVSYGDSPFLQRAFYLILVATIIPP